MDQPPLVLSRHRVHVPAAQIPVVVEVFQLIKRGGVPVRRVVGLVGDEYLDGALELVATVDQQQFMLPLSLERHPRYLGIQHDGHASRHQQHQQQCESRFAAVSFHPLASGSRLTEPWRRIRRARVPARVDGALPAAWTQRGPRLRADGAWAAAWARRPSVLILWPPAPG